MKHGHSFAVGVLALFLAACGGDSHHSSNNNGTTNGTLRVQAVVIGNAADPVYRYQDPQSIQAGDTVQFQLVDADGNPVSDVNWRTGNDAGDTTSNPADYGTISPASGVFTASTSRTSSDIRFIVTGNYNGTDYSAYYKVNPRQVRVLGRVLAKGSLTPLQGVIVDVYGPTNAADPTSATTRLATVTTAVNGTFRVSVRATNDSVNGGTPSPLYFSLRTSSLPTAYHPSFEFRGQYFNSDDTACLASLANADGTAFTTGDRTLVDSTVAASDAQSAEELNGTILAIPTASGERPIADGCIDPTASNG